MSLKAFHVLFVTVATLLTLGFGVWSLRVGDASYLSLGVISMAVAAGLVIYGVWFLRKMKGVSYL
jgi:high-affinity Fe2+/Pb2+ permease